MLVRHGLHIVAYVDAESAGCAVLASIQLSMVPLMVGVQDQNRMDIGLSYETRGVREGGGEMTWAQTFYFWILGIAGAICVRYQAYALMPWLAAVAMRHAMDVLIEELRAKL